ncbi:OmpA/MotB family protein [Polycladidibacter stylochi]|uniref:OmpA/MotB family protein n=1 Tax=Polycladidibacter stylochi TaxID=1807766 RepID=UPI000836FC7A|nr:flagellar motor protein MotB [Pseudovibrio stylochi]
MARKKPQDNPGAPIWMVTFADLMSLLVCFFVLIISFSVQDKEKLQVVAGSIKDAFGVKQVAKRAGVLEIDGLPLRDYMKDLTQEQQETDSDFASEAHEERRKQGPEANTYDTVKAKIEKPRQFATAAVSLRQALQEMPELAEISSNLIVEETKEGLNIQIIDQEGRSMFPEGSKYPYEITRRLFAAIAPVLARLPNPIKITGHTTSGQISLSPSETGWELSAARANATRQILSEYGVPDNQFYAVVGKSDSDPIFPNDPYLASNRRISILLMSQAPPLPPGRTP